MAQARDLYSVLGVASDASPEDIKKAYRALARSYHPDVNADPEAEHRFKEISVAYETLSDPGKRRQYDMYGGEGFTPDMFGFMGDIGDVFEAFFGSPFGQTRTRGGRRSRVQQGSDIRIAMELSFREAVFGVPREVEVERRERCERCVGSGAEPGTSASRCEKCAGAGEVSAVRRSVFGTMMTTRPCPDCEGTGEQVEMPCRDCRGEGRVPQRQVVSVQIPAGVSHGMELRVEHHGEDGRRGGPPGDLYITLHVEAHAVFERRGQDLVAKLEVPLTQALLGVEVEVETLDGTERLKISPGTGSGTIFRMKGYGVPELGGRGRGDLFVEVEVAMPRAMSRKERQLVEQLAKMREELPGKGPIPGRLRPGS